ncbi:MAG: transglutaminase domain-containing protein [Erysipelotrichaceae bacterium]|nr:transglutaminase domain-containing protein [Erysipelotrichaceae bacterium]
MTGKAGRVLLAVIMTLTCLFGCTEKPANNDDPDSQYEIPEMKLIEYNGYIADTVDDACIDFSNTAHGYIGVSVYSDARIKVQVVHDEYVYNYDIINDGTVSYYPLQSGEGYYKVRIMKNLYDSKYAEVYSEGKSVSFDSEFEPFLRPSNYVMYDADSACVKKAREMAENSSSANNYISRVYEWVVNNVRYDNKKAKNVQKGYLPYPDDTFSTGKGICFDYASLTAAMLRSQGVPCKLITGKVAPDDLNHAWNMFYTEETGWITVKFEASGDSWNRLDLTFSVGGSSSEFIGDGTNYSDIYQY